MKPDLSNPLLADLLSEPEIFRAHTLRQTLALARRRRRARFTGRVLALLPVLALAAFLFRPPSDAPVLEPLARASSLDRIHTAPLAANQLVFTQAALFRPISSARAGLVVIHTRTAAPPLDYLSDLQLLAAFPGQHPALIGAGTDQAQLIVATAFPTDNSLPQ